MPKLDKEDQETILHLFAFKMRKGDPLFHS